MIPYISLPSKERVLAMLNASNKTKFTLNQCTFAPVLPNTIFAATKNSSVTITIKTPTGATGKVTYEYNRTNFLFLSTLRPARFDAGTVETVDALLETFNTFYGTALEKEDVDEASVAINAPGDGVGPTIIGLRANTKSYSWLGQINILVTYEPLRLTKVLSNLNLNGLSLF